LNYDAWLANFRQGLEHASHRRQMRIDFTLTLPGLTEIANIIRLATELQVDILAKVVFSFSPDIIFSPLALPRRLLDKKIDELAPVTTGALHDVLIQLRQRPTFEEQWPEQYKQGLVRGKRRVLKLEQIRGDTYTMADILRPHQEIYDWYQAIVT
jgi:hypothetical protein